MPLSATAQRYYPLVEQQPGPDGNVWPEQNACEGVIMHSAEGDWSAGSSPTDTMVQRGVSWHFTIFKDGAVEQHYPLSASCWHAGSRKQNARLIGIEHEGRTGEPLTEAQVTAGVALLRWLSVTCQWPALRRSVTLYEHREVNPGTTCPNGRIPWARYETPLVSEVLPEPDLEDVAAFWQAVVNPASRPDVDVDAIPATRPGWRAFRVEIKE